MESQEVLELIRRCKNNDNKASLALYNRYRYLILKVAKSEKRIEMDDALQEGYFAIVKAAYKYDHKKGKMFSTYAMLWVRQQLNRAAVERNTTIRLPTYLYHRKDNDEKTRYKIQKKIALTPMAALNTSDKNLSRIYENEISADNTTSVDAVMDEQKTNRIIIDGIKTMLSEREQRVIYCRYYNGFTLEKTGKYLGGVSRERVRQIEASAMAALREHLDKKGVEP